MNRIPRGVLMKAFPGQPRLVAAMEDFFAEAAAEVERLTTAKETAEGAASGVAGALGALSGKQDGSENLTAIAELPVTPGAIEQISPGLFAVRAIDAEDLKSLLTRNLADTRYLGAADPALMPDGDYGDIVVSSSGAVVSLDSGVVTPYSRSLLDDANSAAWGLTLGLAALAYKATVNDADWSGADLTITNGGTGCSSIAAMKGVYSIDNVENKSSATIRGELTSGNVTTALGYIPTSVTGITGAQSVAAFKTGLALVKADVGLGSVDNTADAAKNVLTATKLLTARNINGVAFDGSTNITINAADSTARVPETRTISTTAPLTGGGDLSANRTFAISAASGAAAGSMSAADFTKLSNISGTNTGDQTITLTGDVTGSGTGSFAATIGANKVTFAKFVAASAGSIVGATAAGNFSELTPSSARTVLGLATVATSASAADLSAGTLPAARMPALTGDVTTSAGAVATTLATVNSNVGSFGSATQAATFTVNAKGLTTAAANVTITPAVGSITGLGTGVATALAVNVGSAGAFVAFNGALGTPSSGTLTNCTFPTLNQNTTGSAATLTTSRNFSISGGGVTASAVSFNGSANVVLVPTLGAITPSSIATTGFVKSDGAISAKGDASTSPWTGAAVFMDWSLGGYGRFGSYNFTTAAWVPMAYVASTISFRPGDVEALTIYGVLGNYANDAAAAAGGVAVKGMYRNGSILMVRVA